MVYTVSRVRIPYSPYLKWSVGQAVKTPPFHGGNTGSIPVRIIVMAIAASAVLQTRYTGALALHFSIPGGLAQLGDRLPDKQDVGGSIPSTSIGSVV